MGKFVRDLFTNVGNEHWELARVLSFWTVMSTSALAGWKVYTSQPLSLNEYASAMMLVLGGCAVFIGAKDVARAHSVKTEGGATPTTTK